MKILHIITHDKFTAGYIKFMRRYFSDFDHLFITPTVSSCNSVNVIDKLSDVSDVVFYNDWKWLAFSHTIKKYLQDSQLIIVSGLFGFEHSLFYWPSKALNKTYIQYWGGDFYQLRDKVRLFDIKKQFGRYKLLRVMAKSYGAVFLIEDDYSEFMKITGLQKKNTFAAAMPMDPETTYDFSGHRNQLSTYEINIVVGNSATSENEHIDAFERLKHLKQFISVYCPLSYGDTIYRKSVIDYGKSCFGDKFHPVLDWMSESEYFDFLSTMDIGVFANNRQQGMGNIWALLSMGKKVFLRTNTSMYGYYSRIGFKCYDYEKLNECGNKELIEFPEQDNNERIADAWYTPESVKKQWDELLIKDKLRNV